MAALKSATLSFGQLVQVKSVNNSVLTFRVVSVNTGIPLANGNFAQLKPEYPSDSRAIYGNMQVAYVFHRGASLAAPENTIPAYEAAGKAGAWGAEADLQLTLDEEWVLMHDDTVDRTTDGTGDVSTLTLAEIQALDAGSWKNAYFTGTRVPTLSEYLFTCRQYNLVPVIEIKEDGVYTDAQLQKLIDAALFQFPDRQFIIATFSLGILRQLRNLDSTITLQYYRTTYSTSQVDVANEIGRCILASNITALLAATDQDVLYATQNGVTLAAWTVNEPNDADTMVLKGVRLILTDFINLP
jgi:glycerophosphoryl diester phosphodiesterase